MLVGVNSFTLAQQDQKEFFFVLLKNSFLSQKCFTNINYLFRSQANCCIPRGAGINEVVLIIDFNKMQHSI